MVISCYIMTIYLPVPVDGCIISVQMWEQYLEGVRHEDAQDAAVHICMVSDSMKKKCY